MEEIAIIGMSGRFPGAKDLDQFWLNLRDGVEAITRFSDEELGSRGVPPEIFRKPNYVKAGVVLEDIDLFDAAFFGYNAKEAAAMDPQQRFFLEAAWQALEDAACNPNTFDGTIGVFGGGSCNDYRKMIPADRQGITGGFDAFQAMLGNEQDFLASRVSYKLNLKGPSLTIQTACSTSLVAVHLACQNLLIYQCDMALAGGVCIRLPQGVGYQYHEGMIWSPDGHCRAFDAEAKGTIFGYGVGVVVLKRLSEALADGDSIYAVIKGSAINNDGAAKVGFTAPSVDGQAEVLAMAQELAGVEAQSINYIETHGTGTPLGDPVEVEALTQAFRAHTDKKNFCAIGSVKTNIGHLDAAAGVASLIKTVLAMKNKELPPSLHFKTPNPKIDWANSPFFVNSKLTAWESSEEPRRAGVSSFGIGGTNAHIILEEAPEIMGASGSRPWHLLALSARTPSALDTMTANLAGYMQRHPDLNLADAAFTLHTGRKEFTHRRILVCEDVPDAIKVLTAAEGTEGLQNGSSGSGRRDVAFMFSGQGAQHVNMSLGLYNEERIFKEQVDFCAEILLPLLKRDLRDILYPSSTDKIKESKDLINRTDFAQPALFVVEYAMAKLWRSRGIAPAAMVGHSIGEYVAACLSGVFKVEDALNLVVMRGRLMQSMPPGSMLAVPLTEEEVLPCLGPELTVAVINGSSMTVISGETPGIAALQERLSKEKNIECRKLVTSHAFHSRMMEPVLDDFVAIVEKTPRQQPHIPFVSNVSGTWITPKEATSPAYWAKHLRHTVRFDSCLTTLLEMKDCTLLEVGPGQILTLLAKQHPNSDSHVVLPSSRRPVERKEDLQVFLNTLGQLWMAGLKINWADFYCDEKRKKINLPTYPFERQRYWLNEVDFSAENKAAKQIITSKEQPAALDTFIPRTKTEKLLADIWQEIIPNTPTIKGDDNFFDLGGDSLLAVQLVHELEKKTGVDLPLSSLFECPTLKQFARKLDEHKKTVQASSATKGEAAWPCLVPLRSGGNGPPFFCVHGIGGNVLNYKIFLSALDPDLDLYGLQAQGLDGISEPFLSIEATAAHYVNDIRKIQPHGPYLLGGASYGGLVALEMAQQLQKIGAQVALLIMFDTEGPNPKYDRNQLMCSTKSNITQCIEKILKPLASLAAKQGKYYASAKFHLSETKKRIICYYYEKNGKPIPHNLRYWRIENIHKANWKKYAPRKYDGTITLFRAVGEDAETFDLEHGWQGIATGGINVYKIDGKHETFIEESEVGIQLNRVLKNVKQ